MFLCNDFYVYFILISFCNAFLKTKPKNAVSLEGKRVEFECRSDSQNPIDWSFTSAGSTGEIQFYFNWTFYSFYASLYTVERNGTGQYKLIIGSVNFSYAGNYKCTIKTSTDEKEEKESSYSAELIVLESNRIGKEINASHVILNCSVNFRGNWAPELEWSHNGTSIVEGVDASVVPNHNVSSFLVIPRNDSASAGNYTCTTRFDLNGKPNQTTDTSVPSYMEKSNLTIGMEDLHLGDSSASERKASSNSSPKKLIIVAGVLGALCVIIVVLLLLCKKFCGQRKKRMSRNSEPDVLMPMQLYGESTQYEEVQLQDRPGITTGTAASSFDVQDEDVSCETEINAKDGKAKLESGKKKSASYSVVHKKSTTSKTKKKGVVTGADGTVYTEVSLRPDCGKIVPPSDSPRSAFRRVENYVPVDHTWKCLPAPPKI